MGSNSTKRQMELELNKWYEQSLGEKKKDVVYVRNTRRKKSHQNLQEKAKTEKEILDVSDRQDII